MAAANVLSDQDTVVFECRQEPGGHASSFNIAGFTFDEGPHVSFTPHQRIRDFLARSVEQHFFEHPTFADNYYHGITLKHPVQTNLRNLDPEAITECIVDFIRAQYEDRREIHTYQDWCYKQLGRALSERFTRLYTRKYWTRELEHLTTEWVSQRIYAPKLEEVIEGALGQAKGQHYYMSTFRYPARGGFQSFTRLLEHRARIRCGMQVATVDLLHHKLTFANGMTECFEKLISTLPLPELVSILSDAPPAVVEAASRLACTSHLLVSVGVKRPHISDAYWTYFYDEDVPFSRVSFPSKFTPHAAPEGHSSLQAEIVHSRYRPLTAPENAAEQAVDSLLKCGVLRSREEIAVVDVRDIQYANVLFDFERTPNLDIVRRYLSGQGVESCGRFGDWEYLWTDQSILSGERAANAVRTSLGLTALTFDAPSLPVEKA